MSSEASTFTVLLADPGLRDPMALAKALALARKTHVQDQMIAAKNSWGFLAENVSQAEASALVQGLKEAGVASVICASSSLAQLPPAEAAKTLEPLLAARPILIAAAAITNTSTTTTQTKEGPSGAQKILSAAILLGTGLPIKIGGKERIVEKKQVHSELVFYLDVLYKDPSKRFRVDALRFDYSFLKERKLYQLLGNFKLLIGDLIKAAPDAVQNHGVKVLMEGKPMQTMGYNSLADLERETRWLLTLSSIK